MNADRPVAQPPEASRAARTCWLIRVGLEAAPPEAELKNRRLALGQGP